VRLLVVAKLSFLESGQVGRRTLARLAAAERARLVRADAENRRTVREVERHLRSLKIPFDLVRLPRRASNPRYDLILTVGGDGTFLSAAHYARGTPIMGVNSDPARSLGLFTCADRASFPRRLREAFEGRLKATRLNRLSVEIDGTPVPELILNEALFAHRNPASMSRYEVTVDGRRERQRSSGLWISAAAGSTAAILAAGGRKMRIDSRRIQYIVREPYGWPNPHYRLVRGEARRSIELVVLMNTACLWIDGDWARYDVRFGDRIVLRTGAEPAVILGFDRAKRDRLFRR